MCPEQSLLLLFSKLLMDPDVAPLLAGDPGCSAKLQGRQLHMVTSVMEIVKSFTPSVREICRVILLPFLRYSQDPTLRQLAALSVQSLPSLLSSNSIEQTPSRRVDSDTQSR